MSAMFKSFVAGCFSCFEGFRKKPAVVGEDPVVTGAIVPRPDSVIINGVELELDPTWPVEHALGEIMIHLDVSDINTIYIPTTRLEKYHGVAPRVFAPILGSTFATKYVNGEVTWQPHLEQRKIGYQVKGNIVMKP